MTFLLGEGADEQAARAVAGRRQRHAPHVLIAGRCDHREIAADVVAQILFASDAPELFGDPLRACYSMFRIFTIEGWHEIPDAIGRNASAEWTAFARVYFGVAVLVGGILGLSLGNAVFVDQMAAVEPIEGKRCIERMRLIARKSVREHPSRTGCRFEAACAPATIEIEPAHVRS